MPGQPLVVRLARQADHGGTGAPGQLDGERADPAGRPGDHHGVAPGQRYGPDGGIGRGPGYEQRPGDLPGHARGLGGQVLLLDHGILGLAGPVIGVPDNLVPGGEAGHPGAGLGYDPGQVTALPGRERGRPPSVQQTRADLGLARVDPRRLDLDQHLAGSRRRLRHVHDLQDVHVSILIEPYGLHWRASLPPSTPQLRSAAPYARYPHSRPTISPAGSSAARR